MEAYKIALIVLHVLSAIIGIGATFTLGILGSLSGRLGPAAGTALMEGQVAIEKRLINPLALGLLPLTGALMIFARGWNTDFWSHTWLWLAIVLYIIAAGLSTSVAQPGLHKALDLAKGGQGGSPEFMGLIKTQQRIGPFLSLLAVAITVLMVWKPGS